MKKNSLKDSMKGGLNGLLTSTAPSVKESRKKESAPAPSAPAEQQKREPAVHCNFVIDKSIHTRMKYLAIDKNMSLRDIVNEAMSEYLAKHEH
jgi:hypothetical protein